MSLPDTARAHLYRKIRSLSSGPVWATPHVMNKPAKSARRKESAKVVKERAARVAELLAVRYPRVGPALDYTNAWELLVATVLSAQCTDARVNKVTPALFERWPGPAQAAQAAQEDMEETVRSTGFFRNKAKNIIAAARIIEERHGGEVPRTMEELLELPGVARKTANIVLSNAYNVHEGIAVDTHVKRISFRLGFTASTNPTVIERDLMPLFERERWGDVNHYLVYFGREVCVARKPRCSACELAEVCPRFGVETSA